MLIRRAGSADWDVVKRLSAALARELGGEARGRGNRSENMDVENLLKLEDHVFCYVVYEGGQGVGLITSCEVVNFSAGGVCGLITNLYVVPERRRDGLAVALVKVVHKEAISRGWRMLEIASSSCAQNDRLYDFYLLNGFSEIEPQLRMRLR